MVARRVVMARPLVVLARTAGRQIAMAWSTDAISMTEDGQVAGVMRVVDRSRRISIRQIQENSDKARGRQLWSAVQPHFGVFEQTSHRFRHFDWLRNKTA